MSIPAPLKLKLTKATSPIQKVARKYGPEILMGTGAVGVLASGVLLVKQTLTVAPILEAHREELGRIKSTPSSSESEESEQNKAVAKQYVHVSKQMVIHYGPAVSLGLGGLTCILAANGILKRRNAALAAAYQTVSTAFGEYRKRVIAEVGEEKELDIYRGFRSEEIEDPETNEIKSVTVVDTDPNKISAYARFFDESSPVWQKVPEYNLLYLRQKQSYFNDMLNARGFVFLNEVYKELGIPQSQAGNIVGWEIAEDGDNFIDFGIYDFDSERARAFVNGNERSIRLDFNVNGQILHNLKDKI